ncbi:MAG: NAD(P)-dependent oxidoreductase [Chloroflexota bacterium]|nr:NAD(P)-dependent oxidoreductase [Chloroflexota bacterium]
MQNVAVIGLGNMGMGMAKNLLAAGFNVTGFDLRPERGRMLADLGGLAAQSLGELAQADAVFVMVMSGAQVMDVVAGEGGLIRYLNDGAAIIVSATIQPAEIRAVAAAIAGSGLNLIDSPVSGGQSGAEAGTLTMMAAAKAEVFSANQDVLNAVGGQVFHVGEEIGMGQTVKASLQALIGVVFAGIFESLALGAAAGVKGETLYEVFSSTHVANTPFFKSCASNILDRKFEDTGSHISTMFKDIGISMALAREKGLPLFATSAAFELFQAGISRFPEGDNWAIVKLLEEFSGTEVQW